MTTPQDIRIIKVSPPPDSPLSDDVTFHLEPSPPSGWDEAFLEAWNGGGMPFPLPDVDFGPNSIIVKRVGLEYIKNYRIAASLKLAIERAAPIHERNVLAAEEAERHRAEQAAQDRRETNELLDAINQQITDD